MHGYPVGVLANARGVLFSEEAQKAAQFIQLANAADTPLLFLQNTTGYMVGSEYEQGGIIKHGALMINAVSNSHGAAPDRQHRRLVRRRQLRHVRPGVRPAVPVRLAEREVGGDGPGAARRRAVDRGAAGRRGQGPAVYDEDADAAMRAMVEQQIEAESAALFLSGRLYDDGVIDPRDTRTVLGLCLSAVHSATGRGRRGLRRLPDVRRSTSMIRRLLVANRGEIARRVFATCRLVGIETVAVYSDADADAPHVAEADYAVHLPGNAPTETYLRGDLLIDGGPPGRRRRGPPRLRLPVRERRLRRGGASTPG